MAQAAQRLAREVAEGKRDPSSSDADTLGRYLDAPDIPDPDLIIRTSGEQRLSNFLMWQAAYSELVFVPVHWPDFDKAALEGAIAEYARRERRFGGLAAETGSGHGTSARRRMLSGRVRTISLGRCSPRGCLRL